MGHLNINERKFRFKIQLFLLLLVKEVVRVEWGWLRWEGVGGAEMIKVGWVGKGINKLTLNFTKHEQKITFSRFTTADPRHTKLGRFTLETRRGFNRKIPFQNIAFRIQSNNK